MLLFSLLRHAHLSIYLVFTLVRLIYNIKFFTRAQIYYGHKYRVIILNQRNIGLAIRAGTRNKLLPGTAEQNTRIVKRKITVESSDL